MPVEDTIGATGKVIQAAAGLIALMPCLALLAGLVEMPPSLSELMKIITFFLTLGTILVIFVLRGQLRKLPGTLVTAFVATSLVFGCVAAAGFYFFAKDHLISVTRGSEVETYVVPISPSERIREQVDPFLGDYVQALYISPQRELLRQWMDQESTGASAVLILLLALANMFLAGGIVSAATKIASSSRAGGKRPAQGG